VNREKLATLSVILTIILVPAIIVSAVWYKEELFLAKYPGGVKVFDITGVAENGTYTLDTVNGLNYWWKSFEPMTVHVFVGDRVVLRIKTADIVHQFYVPALNLGPIDVKPGHPIELEFLAEKPGVYQYFCISLCGNCHFYMSGWIVITPVGETPLTPPPITCPICVPGYLQRPSENDLIDLGEYLYLQKGCSTCHGNGGIGGIENLNYAKKTVPAHNGTAKKIFLEEEEDTEAFIDLIINNPDLSNLQVEPDIPRFHLILARYLATKELIKKGSAAIKLDKNGPMPPLQMPAWEAQLPDRDIDAILSYFLTLQPWGEDGDELNRGDGKDPDLGDEEKPDFGDDEVPDFGDEVPDFGDEDEPDFGDEVPDFGDEDKQALEKAVDPL
jgi:mono/diheme cytochrome c family protein/plastocyanin